MNDDPKDSPIDAAETPVSAPPAPAKRAKKAYISTSDVNVQKQVAALASLGLTPRAIGDRMGLDHHTIDAVLAKEGTKALIEEIGDDAMRAAKTSLRRSVAGLASKMVAALEYQIDKKKSVQAIALGLKILGLDTPSDATRPGNITVVLPGSAGRDPAAVVINANAKTIKEDE